MIKNITFGGITRIPSAKIIEQGECSESLNVQIDNHEIVPMPEPKQANNVLGLPNTVKGDVLYIHKENGYLNTIVLLTDEETGTKNIGYYVKETNPTTHITKYNFVSIFSIDADDKVVDITSVGNTLVFSSGKKMFYVLFKGGEYEFLGNQVPAPDIKIRMKEEECDLWEYNDISCLTRPWATNDYLYNDAWKGVDFKVEHDEEYLDIINDAFNDGKEISLDNSESAYNLLDKINTQLAKMSEDNEKYGIYNYPVWATVGFRLFDGTCICLPPVLLGCKCGKNFCNIHILKDESSEIVSYRYDYWGASFLWNNAYKIYYEIGEQFFSNLEKWKDLIVSIDFYTSRMIGEQYESLKAAKITHTGEVTVDATIKGSGSISSVDVTYKLKSYILEMYKKYDTFDDLYINNIDNLYLKKRLSYDEIRKMNVAESYEIDSTNLTRYGHVASLEALTNPTFIRTQSSFADMTNINNRVLAYGRKDIFTPVLPFSHSSTFWSNRVSGKTTLWNPNFDDTDEVLEFDRLASLYRPADNIPIPDNGGLSNPMMSISYNSNVEKLTLHSVFGENTLHKNIIPCAVFMIPITQATSIDVQADVTDESLNKRGYTIKNLALKEHPYWPIMYFGEEIEYNGEQIFSSELPLSLFLSTKGSMEETLTPETEKNFIETTNKLYLSEVDSAFSFPIENNYTLPGDIIGVAAASTALSEGQFGNFPLYVFTTQGVYAMSLNSEGTFNGASLVTREIAYKGTITSVDQAVVFVSDKGVMLLTGSQLKCVSSELDGKTYTIGEDIKQIFTDNQEKSLVALLNELDDTPFIDFVKNASSTYDYVNGRIIFFNKEKNYQYVYRFDTGTWHKMSQIWYKDNKPQSVPSPIPFTRVLNSYPDALVVFDAGDSSIVYDFSQRLIQQDEFATTSKGIIVTRPIDLDNPNGYDALKRLRVRGIFQNNEDGSVSHPVKYLLLASNDGVNFTLLHSTRGGSWKYFRLVVLCDLKSTDRLSYITMETEQRYNNKVR